MTLAVKERPDGDRWGRPMTSGVRLGRAGPRLVFPRRHSGRAPGPRGRPLFGSLDVLRTDPLLGLATAANQYGDVVRFRMGPRLAHVEVYLLRNPEHVRHVLQENRANYP